MFICYPVQVPVLLALTYVALWLRPRMQWERGVALV